MESHVNSYARTQMQIPAQTLPPQPTPAFDLSNIGFEEFGTALQHGDLYLWTEEMGNVGFSHWMDLDDVGGGVPENTSFGYGAGAGDLGGWNGFGTGGL